MTVSHLTPPLPVDSVTAACAALHDHGLRVSSARRLVVEALFAADGPVSAERIAEGLDGRLPISDLTSVYRNLETFEAIGLVRHVHLGHGPGLYALSGGAGEREYLVCEACDRIRALDPAELDAVRDTIRAQHGYEVRFSHFPIVGLCPECAGGRTTDRGDHA
jgi:Fur family ferric uptake transcriptional regulator